MGESVSQARILAVDDQLYFRVFLEDLLRESGYDIETAACGTDALDRMAAASFDIVLTDLVMPEMDGSELVQRIKERWPQQEVVVVTSVGDVKTAVDAMKLGATDYLLKPLDKAALLRSLEGILDRMRIRREHQELVAENLDYLSAFSQYERALGLLATTDLEVLADRIVETFCLETNAHSGVAWMVRPGEPQQLRLAGIGGLVRVEDETNEISLDALPDDLAPLAEPQRGALLLDTKEGDGPTTLVLPLRVEGPLLGIVRVSDKLDGKPFGDGDLELADRLGNYASQAVANALAFRGLERRSFRDPTTRAYTRAYFEDVVDNEIQKAQRFGRSFSLVRVALDQASELRHALSHDGRSRLLQQLSGALSGALRTTDLLAFEGEGSFCALLPESETIGAAVARRRLRASLERCAALEALGGDDRPLLLTAAASYPADGRDLAALTARLDQGIEEDCASLVRALDLETVPFRGIAEVLLGDAPNGRPETAEQITRFVLSEVRRRPEERGLLYISPGASLLGPVRDGLAQLDDEYLRTEIVLVADRRADLQANVPVTWVSPVRAGTDCPFLVYYGEASPYAFVREAGSESTVAFYHTADRNMVEHLAFQLGRDLGIPIGD